MMQTKCNFSTARQCDRFGLERRDGLSTSPTAPELRELAPPAVDTLRRIIPDEAVYSLPSSDEGDGCFFQCRSNAKIEDQFFFLSPFGLLCDDVSGQKVRIVLQYVPVVQYIAYYGLYVQG
jgi:hypothetical protein